MRDYQLRADSRWRRSVYRLFVLAIFMAFFTLYGAGCNLSEKIGANITEEISMENDNTDAKSEWPVGDAAEYLPILEEGEIDYVMNGPKACMLKLREITQEVYDSYLKEVKDAGFIENHSESDTEGLKIYSGSSKEEAIATLSYVPAENSLQITLDVSGVRE